MTVNVRLEEIHVTVSGINGPRGGIYSIRGLLEAGRSIAVEERGAGCNDHSIVERLLLGTVSGALVSRAPCSVEVVR